MTHPTPHGLTVLRGLDGRKPLTKRYDIAGNGQVLKTEYSEHKHFSVEVIPTPDILALADHLRMLERDPSAAIIRGAPLPHTDLRKARRKSNGADATFEDVPRAWIMADMDAVPLPASMGVLDDPAAAAQYLLDLLTGFAPELEGVTAVVQLSSSAGIADMAEAEAAAGLPPRWAGVAKPGNRISGHLWFMLDGPELSPELKRWALEVNARAGKKLIDPALYQAVQLHYVAAPIFGQGLRDPLLGRRVHLIEGLEPSATLEIPAASSRSVNAGFASCGSGFTGVGFEARLAAIGTTGFHREINAAIGSYVAANWPVVDTEWLVEVLRARILAAPPGDRSDGQIAAYAAPDALQRRIEWAIDRESEKHEAQAAAQAKPVDPTFPDRGVTLAEGQRQAAEAVARFGDLVRDGKMPEHMLRVTVGVGKSHAAIEALPELLEAARIGQGKRAWHAKIEKDNEQARMREVAESVDRMLAHKQCRDWAPPKREPEQYGPPAPPKPSNGAIYYLVPRHQLGDEIAARILRKDRDAKVATWRGMEADDPYRPGETMCLDIELPRAAIRTGMHAATPCVACPLNTECGYHAQREAAAKADIVIGAHNLAFDQLPSGLPEAAALIIDEGFHQAGLHGLDPKHPVQLLVGALDEDRTPNLTGTRRQRLLNLRMLVREAIEGQEPGQLHRSGFEKKGLTASSLGEMKALEWACKPEIDVKNCKGREDILAALSGGGGWGFTPLRVELAGRLEKFLEGQDARAVGLELDPTAETGRGQGAAPAIRMMWRDLFNDWCAGVPKLMLDATTVPKVVKVWCPKLEVVDIEVSAPHQHVVQVYGRELGKGSFETESNVAAVVGLASVELARTSGDMLLVLQMVPKAKVEAMLRARFGGELPARLHLAHHGNLTGIDKYKDVATILVVGRPAVNRLQGERSAEIIKAGAVEREPDAPDYWWPQAEAGLRMADGTGQRVETCRHRDPLVEAKRWSVAEGAVIQAIGRARGVRRTENKPLRVVLLGSMPLPLTVAEAVTWDAFKPKRLEVAMAEAFLAGRALPLGAKDLAAVRPYLWPTSKAASRDLEGVNPLTLISYIYKGKGIYSAHYRKAGAYCPSLALVPGAGGRAALEAVLGEPLATFKWLEPLPAEAAQPDQSTPAPRPTNMPQASPCPTGAGAIVVVPGIDPPFDIPAGSPPPSSQRDFLPLRVVQNPSSYRAVPLTSTDNQMVNPAACELLASLRRRLFHVRPPRPRNDGLDGVRREHWQERCAQSRREFWQDPTVAGPLVAGSVAH